MRAFDRKFAVNRSGEKSTFYSDLTEDVRFLQDSNLQISDEVGASLPGGVL